MEIPSILLPKMSATVTIGTVPSMGTSVCAMTWLDRVAQCAGTGVRLHPHVVVLGKETCSTAVLSQRGSQAHHICSRDRSRLKPPPPSNQLATH